jgi:hypothetical protein
MVALALSSWDRTTWNVPDRWGCTPPGIPKGLEDPALCLVEVTEVIEYAVMFNSREPLAAAVAGVVDTLALADVAQAHTHTPDQGLMRLEEAEGRMLMLVLVPVLVLMVITAAVTEATVMVMAMVIITDTTIMAVISSSEECGAVGVDGPGGIGDTTAIRAIPIARTTIRPSIGIGRLRTKTVNNGRPSLLRYS